MVILKYISILIAITTFHYYEVRKLYVKVAFLIQKIYKDVFFTQLEDFTRSEDEPSICNILILGPKYFWLF